VVSCDAAQGGKGDIEYLTYGSGTGCRISFAWLARVSMKELKASHYSQYLEVTTHAFL